MMVLIAVPDGALPIAVGTVLALGALSLVLWPLLSDASKIDNGVEAKTREQSAADSATNVTVNGAVAALREIEFDRETGKLSDSDHADLKRRYTQAAIDELRAAKTAKESSKPSVTPAESSDLVEAAIARARAQQKSCTECGPRPEPDATYCSDCGSYLAGHCRECGAAVEMASSRFCSNCGEHLAAV